MAIYRNPIFGHILYNISCLLYTSIISSFIIHLYVYFWPFPVSIFLLFFVTKLFLLPEYILLQKFTQCRYTVCTNILYIFYTFLNDYVLNWSVYVSYLTQREQSVPGLSASTSLSMPSWSSSLLERVDIGEQWLLKPKCTRSIY